MNMVTHGGSQSWNQGHLVSEFIICWIPPRGCPTRIGKNSKTSFYFKESMIQIEYFFSTN